MIEKFFEMKRAMLSCIITLITAIIFGFLIVALKIEALMKMTDVTVMIVIACVFVIIKLIFAIVDNNKEKKLIEEAQN